MNYYGGNERSSSSSANGSSSSSRKGKKNVSDKPRQPQRGLGVAQLEKIRLHTQMGYLSQEDIRIQTPYSSSSSSSLSYSSSPSTNYFTTLPAGHHSHMMGTGELERPNIVYGETHVSTINPRWDASSAMLEAQGYAQPAGVSRYQFNPELLEGSFKKKRKDQNDSLGSSNQNSDSNGSQELDLELRLSF